jgi:hypothetical protein
MKTDRFTSAAAVAALDTTTPNAPKRNCAPFGLSAARDYDTRGDTRSALTRYNFHVETAGFA